MAEFLTIGAATRDIQAMALAPVVPGTSNPARLAYSFGGVARNVSVTLARLGGRVTFITRTGTDSAGDAVARDLVEWGVYSGSSARSATLPTASYFALLEPDSSLHVGFSDTSAIEDINPEQIGEAIERSGDCPIWFLDANLAEPVVRHIAALKPPGIQLAADGTSVSKVRRLEHTLTAFDWLFVNRDEAAALTGLQLDSEEAYANAAGALRRAGPGRVVILLGAEGLIAACGDRQVRLPALDCHPVSATGAGDAAVAGTLFGVANGFDLEAALKLGLACGAITLESGTATSARLELEQVRLRAGLGPDAETAS